MHTLVDFSLFKLPLKLSDKTGGGHVVNRDLWKQALENSDLYTALKEFKVVDGKKNPSVLLEQSNVANPSSAVNRLQDNDNVMEEGTKFSIVSKEANYPVDNHFVTKQDNENDQTSKLVKLTQTAELFTTAPYLDSIVGSPEYNALSKIPLSVLNRINWLDKNTLITLVDSNLEVWLRDSAAESVNLKDVLNTIKHSMADIGVTLVKVTINGKVVFKKN